MSNSTWNNISNVAGWLGAIVACIGLYFQFFNKHHELSFSLTSFEVASDEVVIGVIYRNTGDYQEAILNGSMTMDNTNEKGKIGGVGFGFNLADCFTPIVLEPNGIHHKYYKIPLKRLIIDKDYIVGNTITSVVGARFYFLLPDNRVGNAGFNLGEVIHRVKEGNIKKFEVTNNNHQFDFTAKGNYGLGSTGVNSNPDPEYDVNHCAKKA